MEITNSELATYQQCPKKWDLKYPQMLTTQKDSKNNPLFFGSTMHLALEKFFKEGIIHSIDFITLTYDETIKEYGDDERIIEDLKEHKDLMLEMIAMYAPIANEYNGQVIEVRDIEKEGKIQIGKINNRPLYYRFKIDQLVWFNNAWWIREYKTASRIDNSYIENLMLDNQVSRYIYAAEKAFGIKIAGIIYEVFVKAKPEKPKLLKSGELSKSLTTNITYDTYLQAIKENNLNEADYNEQLTILKEKGNPFFYREFIMRNAKDLQNTKDDLLALSKILRQRNKIPTYKCPSRDCGWKCEFRQLCIDDNDGTRSMYVKREKYHPEY